MDLYMDTFTTGIWNEEASENPFYAENSFCYGYNVFKDVLGKASYSEYLYLMFTGQRIAPYHEKLLEKLMIALAHPGIRHPSVHAAMCASVGGSRSAAALMASLAVGAGQSGGAHEVRLSLMLFQSAQQDLNTWAQTLKQVFDPQQIDVWFDPEHVPGFDPHLKTAAPTTLDALKHLADAAGPESQTQWLLDHYQALEKETGNGVAITGVTAAALYDLKFTPELAEYFYLFARLPGAAVQAEEARQNGVKAFPFFHDALKLQDEA
ncbi:MAG TPA: citryl-CoA lyase [Gammaproteobacteria bacterium]|nr:citryl-CoA lyase [Gammaproteobacteria bacterium]HCK93890.1 citryl-CoA lyase [Gammaproteobacteria bacterium]|tara:strand:- start:540 stop:1334 length:795 start_codon:yes stop_codon:yes gene_type:complete